MSAKIQWRFKMEEKKCDICGHVGFSGISGVFVAIHNGDGDTVERTGAVDFSCTECSLKLKRCTLDAFRNIAWGKINNCKKNSMGF
jgi:hypothetical protein